MLLDIPPTSMRATQVVVGPGREGLLEAKAILEDAPRCSAVMFFRRRGSDGA